MVYQCHYPTASMQTARGAKQSAAPRPARRARRVLPRRQRLGGRRLVRAARARRRTPDRCRGAGRTGSPGGRPSTARPARASSRWTCRSCRSSSCRAATPAPLLEHLSANHVDGEPGVITYTQWLNEGGTLEADLTVTKLDDERFWVVASDTAHRHAETWMRRHIADDTARLRHRHDLGLRAAQRAGAAVARAAAVADVGRPVQRGVPVPHRARDRHRLRARAVRPDHLPRRARLRAVHPGRAGDARVRPAGRRRPGVRPAARRAQGARQPADGEGLPRLRPRHRQHRLGARGGPRVRGRPSTTASSGAAPSWRRRRRAR